MLEAFCAANQHIVPKLAAYLKAANATNRDIPSKFFDDASKIPLVVCNKEDEPAWEFGGCTIRYHPGRVAYNMYENTLLALWEIRLKAFELMDPCCKKGECKDHFTEASARHKETYEAVYSLKKPMMFFTLDTGKKL
jgi:hypothetical protein